MICTTPPPWKVPPPPIESATPPTALWCMAIVAAKYIGLWGQISSLDSFSRPKLFPYANAFSCGRSAAKLTVRIFKSGEFDLRNLKGDNDKECSRLVERETWCNLFVFILSILIPLWKICLLRTFPLLYTAVPVIVIVCVTQRLLLRLS